MISRFEVRRLLEIARDAELARLPRMTAWELTVARALADATYVDDRSVRPLEFQVFREEMTLSIRQYGYILDDQAHVVGRLPVLRRIVGCVAQWSVHGPARSQVDQGPNGSLLTLARLPGIVDGETGYELPPGRRLAFDVARYFPYVYHRLSGVDGSESECPTVAAQLWCRWRLEDAP